MAAIYKRIPRKYGEGPKYAPIEKDVVIEKLKADSNKYPELRKFPNYLKKFTPGLLT